MENTNKKSNETENKLDFDIDKFNIDLAESIRHMQETCDRINIENGTMTFEDIGNRMEEIQKKMLWDKVCYNSKKIDLMNEKLDMIIKKLGVHYGR